MDYYALALNTLMTNSVEIAGALQIFGCHVTINGDKDDPFFDIELMPGAVEVADQVVAGKSDINRELWLENIRDVAGMMIGFIDTVREY